MSEENRISKEERKISKLDKEIQAKVIHMQESEGEEIELSENDLDSVDGGKSAWEITYKTTS